MSNKAFPGKYKTPEYSATLPLTQTKVAYRPYNVGDERILAAAVSARETDPEFYITNTLKVIQGVTLSDVNISKLPAIDVRFLLLSMRSKSVGEVIEFLYKEKKVEANILDFYLTNVRDKSDYNIDIGNGYGVQMTDLTFEDEIRASAGIEKGVNKVDIFYQIMLSSIVSIYTENDVFVVGQDMTRQEMEEFIHSVPGDMSRKIYEFVQTMPSLSVDINVEGKKVTISDREVDFLSSARDT